MNRAIRAALVATACAALSAPAAAHSGHGETSGFAAGFLHPVGGIDHLIAIISIGVLAAMLDRRQRFVIPSTFLVFMALGAALSMGGLELAFMEMVIAGSVVAVGLMIASGVKLPALALVGFAAIAAVFHGAAHGAELPPNTDGLLFGAGFLSATALLLGLGLAIGSALERIQVSHHWPRPVYGMSAAVTGAALLVLN